MAQQKVDLDELEAALARYGDHTPLDIKFALPALIAELRELRDYRDRVEAIFAPEAQ